MRLRSISRLCSAAALLASAGCGGSQSTAPVAGRAPAVAPALDLGSAARWEVSLHVGDRRSYRYFVAESFVAADGETLGAKIGSAPRVMTLVGTELRNGVPWVREDIADSTQLGHFVSWLRQDHSGLFEVSATLPGWWPNLSWERRLAYPMHVGQRWYVRSASPPVTAEVVAYEQLDLQAGRTPAWKIRIHDYGHGPEEQYVWYGAVGFVGSRFHSRSTGRLQDGRSFTRDDLQEEWLTSYELADSTQPAMTTGAGCSGAP